MKRRDFIGKAGIGIASGVAAASALTCSQLVLSLSGLPEKSHNFIWGNTWKIPEA